MKQAALNVANQWRARHGIGDEFYRFALVFTSCISVHAPEVVASSTYPVRFQLARAILIMGCRNGLAPDFAAQYGPEKLPSYRP